MSDLTIDRVGNMAYYPTSHDYLSLRSQSGDYRRRSRDHGDFQLGSGYMRLDGGDENSRMRGSTRHWEHSKPLLHTGQAVSGPLSPRRAIFVS